MTGWTSGGSIDGQHLESASYIVEWSSAGKSSPQSAILKVGDELVLPDGFRLKAEQWLRTP